MKKIRFYRTCPLCGAHLDPGENCTDCKNREEARLLDIFRNMTEAEKLEVLAFTKFVLKRQEQGLTVSEEEAAQMLKEAKERLAQAERLTA